MSPSMVSSHKDMETKLFEAGIRLTEPPTSVDALISFLDKVEHFLGKVEQSPPKSMQNALCPLLKALVSDQLFKHMDANVKAAVACCISEITRITAPEAPYDDEQMKDVFQLIVSSFENLADKSSQSYYRRISILETVAKVRSCVVMLDLECDALINEMFDHFLKAIRDYHPVNVFSSMETIMTLVLLESEDISFDLLSPLLISVKKNNKEVTPIAQKLAEKVLKTCAIKLKPYLIRTIRSLGISLDDYGGVVASICQETLGVVDENDAPANDAPANDAPANDAPANDALDDAPANDALDDAPANDALDDAPDDDAPVDDAPNIDAPDNDALANELVVNNENVTEVVPLEQVKTPEHLNSEQIGTLIERSPMSTVTQTGEDRSLIESNLIHEQEHDHILEQSNYSDTPSMAKLDNLNTEKLVNGEMKEEQNANRKKNKSNSLKLTEEPSNISFIDGEKNIEGALIDGKKIFDSNKNINGEKEVETLPDNKDCYKDVPTLHDDPSVEACMSFENEKETGILLSSPKTIEAEPMNATSLSSSRGLPDKNCSKKSGRVKKKESSMKEKKESSMKEKKESSMKETKESSMKETKESSMKETKESSMKETKESSMKETKATNDKAKNASEITSDSEATEAKSSIKSRKKVLSGISDKNDTKNIANASKKAYEGTNDSEVKPNRLSGKRTANDGETSTVKDAPKKRSGISNDSKAKPLKQSATEIDSGSNDDEESLKLTMSKKKRSRAKAISTKDSSIISTIDQDKGIVSSPKSVKNSRQIESLVEETPKTNSKRQRTVGKEPASSQDFGEDIVGLKVKVLWPEDEMYYKGVVRSFDLVKKLHEVFYDDGDVENLDLKSEMWELLGSDSEPDKERADCASPNNSSEVPQRKKAKLTSSEQSPKQGKAKTSSKRTGGSSSKSKPTTTKSGQKSKDHATKSSCKLVEVASNSAAKSKNDGISTPKSGKSKVDASSKPKQEIAKGPKSKQETTEAVLSNTKGKPSKSGGKQKSGSSKAKDDDNLKDDSTNFRKSEESTKGKSTSSGKKRRR